MERRLRSFLARQGITRLSDCLNELRSDRSELDALLDRVTINVSHLWRHEDQWSRLAENILPELAERGRGRVRAWSAGCSYGAEAYTLAAVCRLAAPSARTSILGTDIDPRMVSLAREGVFSGADARDVPAETMERWFEPASGGWCAKQQLRAMTTFEVGDLLRIRRLAATYDLILCRNTVIYFADAIRDGLHARLAHALRPGGCLVVGGTERVNEPAAIKLEPIHPFIYRKR